ncbi:MAG: phenylalanine--tRNA ligase beta subunit-related protein [Acidobacteriota bacterium]|nr:phenylalanine--tRNA ligase beta subunit-related protein [Acidobacteriota bacterium]MDQ3169496.1 phenylalanine--tRNA ligase beta subunit-related protein [Acidobacteriota bacterium]
MPNTGMILVDETVAPHVRPAWLALDDVRVAEGSPLLEAAMAETAARMRGAADAVDLTAAVRAMYRRFGVDPTRTRPSSEALLRRARKGDALPRINNVVDVCNWCSLEFQTPYGLYDAGRLRGAITLRTGRAAESYAGIRKDDVHLEGRLVLADEEGAFGNPTSDSARTMVTTASAAILAVIFAPASTPAAGLRQMLDVTSARMREYAGGAERSRGIADNHT